MRLTSCGALTKRHTPLAFRCTADRALLVDRPFIRVDDLNGNSSHFSTLRLWGALREQGDSASAFALYVNGRITSCRRDERP